MATVKHKNRSVKTTVPTWQKSPWLWGGLALIIGLGLLFVLRQTGPSSSGYPLEVSVAEAVAKQKAGAFILDVRQPEEWSEGHVAGATLIPLGELPARLSEVPKDQEVVVVCHSGNRSAKGRDILRQAGFSQVTSMAGGMAQWQSDGYPTVSGP